MAEYYDGPIAISGLGSVHCLGLGIKPLWNNVLNSVSGIHEGIGKIKEETLEQAYQDLLHSPYKDSIKNLRTESSHDKTLILTLAAIQQALQQAGNYFLSNRDAFLFVSTTGHITHWEDDIMNFSQDKLSPEQLLKTFSKEPLGVLSNEIQSIIGIPGQTALFSSACSASTQAIHLGSLLLKQNRIDRCLIGGVETLSKLTLEGFKSLGLLTNETAKPFDQDRSGINLAEGAAFIVLEKKPKQVLAHLSSGSLSSEAYHMTSPHPEGKGYFRCMEQALKKANLLPQDISWIHSHGTGSVHNDFSEGKAISQLFKKSKTLVSSTKAIHGHTLGISGVLEIELCVKAIAEKQIPPTKGLINQDSNLDINIPLKITNLNVNHVIKNSAGFGSNNASLIISKAEL